jgi:hypothetical protein
LEYTFFFFDQLTLWYSDFFVNHFQILSSFKKNFDFWRKKKQSTHWLTSEMMIYWANGCIAFFLLFKRKYSVVASPLSSKKFGEKHYTDLSLIRVQAIPATFFKWRNEVYVDMSELNFPTKLIRITKATLTIVACCFKIQNDCSESFESRQADVLSTLLFNVVLEVIVRRNKTINQWHDNPWERSPNLWIKA